MNRKHVRHDAGIRGAFALLVLVVATAAPGWVEADTDVQTDTSPRDAGDVTDAAPSMDADAGADDAVDVADTGGADGDTADALSDVDTGADALDDARDGDGGGPEDTGDTVDGADVVPDADVGSDAEAGADAGPAFDFFGRVSVQFRGDASGVTLTLTRSDGSGEWEQTTEEDGAFRFEGLARGEYEVEIALDGYRTIGEAFTLAGDRQRRFRLLKNQNVELQVRALFPEGGDLPDQVDFVLEGERGTRRPEEPVSVEDGNVAVWRVEEVGVGNWTVTASAEGYRSVSYDFQARGPDSQADALDLRLYMRPEGGQPPAPDTSGCNCGGDDSGGGAPSPGPYAPPAMIVVFGLGLVLYRSFREDR